MKQLSLKFHEAAGLFPLLDDKELGVLVESMRLHGFDPSRPVLRYRGAILDGRNRLRAAEVAGVRPCFLDLPDDCDPFAEAWKHNGARRDLEPIRKAGIFLRIMELSGAWQAEQEAAREKANRGRSETQKGVSKKEAVERAASREAPRSAAKTAARLAAQAGVSRATVERAQELKRKAPERFEAMIDGTADGARELRELKRGEQLSAIAKISAKSQPLDGSIGQFPIIYADPPWRYDDNSTDPTREIENQYPTMALSEICAMPVRSVSTDNALLFLWATSPLLAQAMRVVEAWGFSYKTCAVWDKGKIGMGYFFRQQHELLLVAERGTMPKPPPAARPSSVIRIERGAHSAKPLAVYSMIEEMYPTLPRLELFCRSPRQGWVAWGNQVAA